MADIETQAPPLIYQLIPRVMADVGHISKDRKNTQQGYSFRGIDDVFAAFQPVLAKHGVFYVPEVLSRDVTERQSRSGSVLIYTLLEVAYTFYAPDGSFVRAVVIGEGMDSGDKSSNKALSAALKYAMLQIFCVPTEELNSDADRDSHELAGDAKRATQGQAQQTPVGAQANGQKAEMGADDRQFWQKVAALKLISGTATEQAAARQVAERVRAACEGPAGKIDFARVDRALALWKEAGSPFTKQPANAGG